MNDIDELFGGNESLVQEINQAESFFNDSMEELRFYFFTIEAFITKQSQKDVADFEKKINQLSPSMRGQYFEYYYPFYWDSIFMENFKNTFILSLISVLEHHLRRLCLFLGNGNIKPKNRKSGGKESYIEAFQRHIEGTTGKKLHLLKWDVVNDLYIIRNKIAHNDGYCRDTDKDRLKEFSQENIGVDVNSHSYLDFDISFCWRTHKTIQSFFHELCEILRNHFLNFNAGGVGRG